MIKTYTKIEDRGLAPRESGMSMEYGYGIYVNAYVVDTEFSCPELNDEGEQGLWASICLPFDADDSAISKARKRVSDRARGRYRRKKAKI